MIVTILRHGEAGPAAADRERRLTSRGVTDIERAAPVLVAACRSRALALPQRVLHSPWERTRATAQIVAQHLQVEARPLDALAPGATSLQVDEALALQESEAEAPAQHCLLVSHQPLVSQLADHYLGEPGLAPGLSPGALLTLSLHCVAPGCGSLQFWALPPAYEVAR
ncbi:MAG: hypothetical protein CME59_09830 [Halioglobus sp.]|nr:hypothetical protein [Halioglobus sp.]